jgi:hypothetical protein
MHWADIVDDELAEMVAATAPEEEPEQEASSSAVEDEFPFHGSVSEPAAEPDEADPRCGSRYPALVANGRREMGPPSTTGTRAMGPVTTPQPARAAC